MWPWDKALWRVAFGEIRTQDQILRRALLGGGKRKHQGRSRVIEPDFRGIDAVPMAALARFEQEIDCGARRPLARGRLGDPGLAIPATLGVGGEV